MTYEDRSVLVSPIAEVAVLEGELVTTIRELAGRGVGTRAIAQAGGVAPNTVRRYLRDAVVPGVQRRPRARRLDDTAREEAGVLYQGVAEGNAVVVQRLLRERDVVVSVRTIERAVADIRQARRVETLATVRFETPPGDQLQIDFGRKTIGSIKRSEATEGSFSDARPTAQPPTQRSMKRYRRSGRWTFRISSGKTPATKSCTEALRGTSLVDHSCRV